APGTTAFARLHLSAPMALLPGDRFVLRGFARTALGATLGGGIALDVSPPHRRRSDADLVRELEELARRDPDADVHVRVRRGGLGGRTRAALAGETGRVPGELAAAIDRARRGGVLETAGERVLDAGALARVERSLLDALAGYHATEPLRPGMPSGALRGALP